MAGLPQSQLELPIFLISGVALSVFMTWIYVNTRGSILVAGIVPHAIVNAFGGQMPSMTPIPCLVLVVAAALLVVIAGRGLRHASCASGTEQGVAETKV